ncbi:MAG: LapA family protein [Synergistaceae bacterium]|nr:LapA family protein [Synergistaceae bacterium]
MKSYILAITVTMFLSALFAFQNIGDVTVRFLIFEWMLPQGVWEVLVFCAGAAIMWIFSIFSMFEVRGKYKKEIKAKDEKIAAVEKEKKTILESVAAARAPLPASEETGQGHNTEVNAPGGMVE